MAERGEGPGAKKKNWVRNEFKGDKKNILFYFIYVSHRFFVFLTFASFFLNCFISYILSFLFFFFFSFANSIMESSYFMLWESKPQCHHWFPPPHLSISQSKWIELALSLSLSLSLSPSLPPTLSHSLYLSLTLGLAFCEVAFFFLFLIDSRYFVLQRLIAYFCS